MPMTRILPPFSYLRQELARKANIRQWLSGARTCPPPAFCACRIRRLASEKRPAPPSGPESAEKDDKILPHVMQWLHGGLAWHWLALHMQHDYLASIEGISLRFVQLENRMKAMAAVETTRPAPFGAITTYRAINALSNAISVFATWNDSRVTRNALNKLSDRELDDIGLCRGDIDMIGR
jgi:uncharacterized protein YjiS (DUF1127 family)